MWYFSFHHPPAHSMASGTTATKAFTGPGLRLRRATMLIIKIQLVATSAIPPRQTRQQVRLIGLRTPCLFSALSWEDGTIKPQLCGFDRLSSYLLGSTYSKTTLLA